MSVSKYEIKQGNELRIQCYKGKPLTIEVLAVNVDFSL